MTLPFDTDEDLAQIKQFPRHIAIIMDGNRRWAKKLSPHNLPIVGHQAGYLALKNLLNVVVKIPAIEVMTVYAFSTENWKRSEDEVNAIMTLATSVFLDHLEAFHEKNVRLRVIGDRKCLSDRLQQAIKKGEDTTAENFGPLLVIAFNYGGLWDLTQAFKKLTAIDPTPDITEKLLESALPSSFLPPVDLLIRTGGERRISNFLPWQIGYAELYFSDVLWPDFNRQTFCSALNWFDGRLRRFGGSG